MRISDWSSDVCSSDLDTYSTHLPQALSENCPVVPVRGTAKPLDRTDVPKPLPCALQAGNRLLHPLIANWNRTSLGCVRQVLQLGGLGAGHAALRSCVFLCSRSLSRSIGKASCGERGWKYGERTG